MEIDKTMVTKSHSIEILRDDSSISDVSDIDSNNVLSTEVVETNQKRNKIDKVKSQKSPERITSENASSNSRKKKSNLIGTVFEDPNISKKRRSFQT